MGSFAQFRRIVLARFAFVSLSWGWLLRCGWWWTSSNKHCGCGRGLSPVLVVNLWARLVPFLKIKRGMSRARGSIVGGDGSCP